MGIAKEEAAAKQQQQSEVAVAFLLSDGVRRQCRLKRYIFKFPTTSYPSSSAPKSLLPSGSLRKGFSLSDCPCTLTADSSSAPKGWHFVRERGADSWFPPGHPCRYRHAANLDSQEMFEKCWGIIDEDADADSLSELLSQLL